MLLVCLGPFPQVKSLFGVDKKNILGDKNVFGGFVKLVWNEKERFVRRLALNEEEDGLLERLGENVFPHDELKDETRVWGAYSSPLLHILLSYSITPFSLPHKIH